MLQSGEFDLGVEPHGQARGTFSDAYGAEPRTEGPAPLFWLKRDV